MYERLKDNNEEMQRDNLNINMMTQENQTQKLQNQDNINTNQDNQTLQTGKQLDYNNIEVDTDALMNSDVEKKQSNIANYKALVAGINSDDTSYDSRPVESLEEFHEKSVSFFDQVSRISEELDDKHYSRKNQTNSESFENVKSASASFLSLREKMTKIEPSLDMMREFDQMSDKLYSACSSYISSHKFSGFFGYGAKRKATVKRLLKFVDENCYDMKKSIFNQVHSKVHPEIERLTSKDKKLTQDSEEKDANFAKLIPLKLEYQELCMRSLTIPGQKLKKGSREAIFKDCIMNLANLNKNYNEVDLAGKCGYECIDSLRKYMFNLKNDSNTGLNKTTFLMDKNVYFLHTLLAESKITYGSEDRSYLGDVEKELEHTPLIQIEDDEATYSDEIVQHGPVDFAFNSAIMPMREWGYDVDADDMDNATGFKFSMFISTTEFKLLDEETRIKAYNLFDIFKERISKAYEDTRTSYNVLVIDKKDKVKVKDQNQAQNQDLDPYSLALGLQKSLSAKCYSVLKKDDSDKLNAYRKLFLSLNEPAFLQVIANYKYVIDGIRRDFETVKKSDYLGDNNTADKSANSPGKFLEAEEKDLDLDKTKKMNPSEKIEKILTLIENDSKLQKEKGIHKNPKLKNKVIGILRYDDIIEIVNKKTGYTVKANKMTVREKPADEVICRKIEALDYLIDDILYGHRERHLIKELINNANGFDEQRSIYIAKITPSKTTEAKKEGKA